MTPVATYRYRRRNGVAFFFRSFCFLFWFFFVLFKEGSLGVSWSKLTRGQRDTASGRGKEWVPAMPDRPFAGAVGKEPISRSFCKNPEKRKRDRGKRPITFSFLTLWAHTFKNKWLEKAFFRAKEVHRIEKKYKFAPIIYHS